MDKTLEELMADAFELAPAGLEVLRLQDRNDLGSWTPLAANAMACQAAGSDLKADLGRPWSETAPGLAASDFPMLFFQALGASEPVTWEMEYGDGRFEKNWWRGRANKVDSDTVLITFEQFTERKQLELALAERTKQLEAQSKELARSNADLDQFAYVASHDLKAPLRNIRALATWLTEDMGDNLKEESQRHLATMHERINHMQRLLDDLLLYSRVRRAGEPPTKVSIAKVVASSMVETVPPGFTIETPHPDVEFFFPQPALELVLRNLIGNAIKHHDRPDGRISIECWTSGEDVNLAVQDDGPGIAAQDQERVFRMFEKLSRSNVDGTGMGLALVKKVVERYGGQVRLESSPGKGCRFELFLPGAAFPPFQST